MSESNDGPQREPKVSEGWEFLPLGEVFVFDPENWTVGTAVQFRGKDGESVVKTIASVEPWPAEGDGVHRVRLVGRVQLANMLAAVGATPRAT